MISKEKLPWGAERAELGGYEQQHSNNLNVRNDVLLAYNKRFLEGKLSLDALGGFSYNYGESNSSGFSGNNLTLPNSFNFKFLLPDDVRRVPPYAVIPVAITAPMPQRSGGRIWFMWNCQVVMTG
ncbi:MAG: hypothetical protein M9933_13800 [Chitinophagaceae bacterium]|nr:hypothetical protein [Chitinophagaceae bacterium]